MMSKGNGKRDLFLAILSLDAYYRGYHPRISGLPYKIGTKIGNAKITKRLEDVSASFELESQSAGFYAVAYDTPYGTVIAYRGTDNSDFFGEKDDARDVWRGWTIGAGYVGSASQAGLA